MNWISHSIRNKLLFITGTGTALFFAAVLFGLWSLWGSIKTFETEVDNRRGDEIQVMATQMDFKKQVQEWKDVLLRGSDPAMLDKYWGNFEKQERKVQEGCTALQAQVDDSAARSLIAEFKQAHLDMGVAYRRGLQAFRDGNASAKAGDAAVKGMDRAPAELLTRATAEIKNIADNSASNASRKAARGLQISLGLMALAVVLSFILFLVIVQRTILVPAKQLAQDLEQLAKGNFSKAIRHSTEDEIGKVAASAEQIRRDLGAVLANVENVSKELNLATARMVKASSQVAEGSHLQSDAATAAASSVEEIAASIASVSDNADSVNQLSQLGLQRTVTGNEKLSELIGEIVEVEESVNEISSSVAEFIHSTAAITNMTREVKDIADQTNLLALNAAIEAARAGEQGRGFAVVADEVRKLAEKSAQSANQIDKVTMTLGDRSSQVEHSIERSQKSLQTSQDFMEEVAIALGEANQSVSAATNGVDTITHSVNEQKVASNEIARNVERIAEMAERNKASAHENDQEAVNMERLARQLHDATSRFRL
jgi:methyl-accepting chemotaxis protein